MRIEPDGAQAVASFRVREVGEEDAIGAWIREWKIGLGLSRRVG